MSGKGVGDFGFGVSFREMGASLCGIGVCSQSSYCVLGAMDCFSIS